MSTTRLETPTNLLASGPVGVSSSRAAKRDGRADHFASMLEAQKPRTTLADSAREAQRSRHSAELSERRKTSERRATSETNEKPKGEHQANASSEDESSDSDVARASREAQRAERAGNEHMRPERQGSVEPGRTDVDAGAVAAIALLPTNAVDDVATTAPAAGEGELKRTTTAAADGALKASHAEVDENSQAPSGAKSAEQPERTSQRAQHSQVGARLPRNVQGEENRASERRTVVDRSARTVNDAEVAAPKPSSSDGEAKPRAPLTGTRADNGTTGESPRDAAAEAGREVVRRAAHDTFRQSAAHADDEPAEDVARLRSRAVRHEAPQPPPVRAVAAGAKATESEVQNATRQAIDALLDEQAPRRHVDNPNDAPRSQPLHASSSNGAATSAPPGALNSSAAAATASAFEASSPTPGAATALPGSTVSVTTLGTTTLTGEASLNSASNTASGAEWMTRSDHAAGRILRGLSTMIHQHGGSMSMRLDPPELGSLRIQMTIQNGSVSATFTPTSAAARGLLEQNMAQLKTALESQGLMVDRLSIQSASPSQTNAQAGQQHGTDGRGTNEQSSQYADAGHGESRGRSEREGEQRREAEEFFDPTALFESFGLNDGTPFAQHASGRAERSIHV